MMNVLEASIFCVLCCYLATQNLDYLVLSVFTVVMAPGSGNLRWHFHYDVMLYSRKNFANVIKIPKSVDSALTRDHTWWASLSWVNKSQTYAK